METESIVKPEQWAPLVPPIFARCVDPDNFRFNLAAPFLQDDWLYATNGHVCVRTPRPESWPFPQEGKYPQDLDGNAFALVFRAEPTAIPDVVGHCETCQGAKVLPERECRMCQGDGEIDCDCDCPHCDYTEECEDCGASGVVGPGPCPDCRGSGVARGLDRLKIAEGYWIGRAYAALLREFGAALYLPASPEPKDCVRFTAGDAEGVLMVMTRPNPGEGDQ